MFQKWRKITGRIEPAWTLIGAPIVQELIFRFLPYQLFLVYGKFWEIGIVSSILFTTIHYYFGKWFMLYSFLWGIILWWLMANYGLLAVIIVHSIVNLIHIQIGLLPKTNIDEK